MTVVLKKTSKPSHAVTNRRKAQEQAVQAWRLRPTAGMATTFLRAAADETGADELNTPDIRHRVLHHATEIVAVNLLAMTVQCAKCHDHKYDPITQRDFYSLAAILSPAFNPTDWKQPDHRQLADIPLPARAEIDEFNAPIEKRIVLNDSRIITWNSFAGKQDGHRNQCYDEAAPVKKF